ncbi:sensor histidine kinase [Phenylobacterium sp.]|uniref:sensor histidine kinase n=1 Tax=Phenylobacterium sp. TaxID=1871053 RepID=UPI0025E5E139|nr:sensor histidine kinase [Phenylobacterium sp.]MBX3484100.1 sensor histidine kinase [Phenylobacterium sp.]
MAARSLQLRLLASAAVAVFVALAVAWLAMTWLFERHVERREAAELARTGDALAAALTIDAAGRPALDQTPLDPRALRAASGFYWQVSTPRGVVRSPSLWDEALPVPAGASPSDWAADTTRGPFGRRLLRVARAVRAPGADAPAVIQVGVDARELAEARAQFGRELALFLAGLWAVLALAALAQVRLGLAPLAPLRDRLQRMRRNPAARLDADHPREVAPLVTAINALAETRQADLARARRRAGDLAHSLKTPLAALAAQSRLARDAGATEAADGLDGAIAAMAAALEAELARARAAAARDAAQDECSSPAAVVERLIAVLERTPAGERIVFAPEIDPALSVPVAADVLAEVLGALMENAARFARRQVRLTAAPSDQAVSLTVEDDGPGLDAERAEAALIRGGRLDEAGPGHGLGLAIVRDLVEATDGAVTLDRSPLGGLRVAVSWPASTQGHTSHI